MKKRLMIGCIVWFFMINFIFAEDIVNFEAKNFIFPDDIAMWKYKTADGEIVKVWTSQEGKYKTVYESGGKIFTDINVTDINSPFMKWRTDEKGNLLTYGKDANQDLKDHWMGAIPEGWATPQEIQNMDKTFKFVSEEWLMVPAIFKHRDTWAVNEYSFVNMFDSLQKEKIQGTAYYRDWNGLFTLKGKTFRQIILNYQLKESMARSHGFCLTCAEHIGVTKIEVWDKDNKLNRTEQETIGELLDVGYADAISIGQFTTTWGAIKKD